MNLATRTPQFDKMEFTKSESQLGKIAKWGNSNMDFTIWQSELGKTPEQMVFQA